LGAKVRDLAGGDCCGRWRRLVSVERVTGDDDGRGVRRGWRRL